ncbi:MAG: arginine deiminase family protein [Halioglobus sp.]
MSHDGVSFRFNNAIARLPGKSIVEGIRAEDRGAPDLNTFMEQHRRYVEALEAAGVTVTVLPALEDFPDSVFVEDAAFCLPERSVALRPGALARRGEAAIMAADLMDLGHSVAGLAGAGCIDGGDILLTDKTIMVGASERTDEAGIEALATLVADWGYTVTPVETPSGVLHFKSDCCVLDSDTVLATSRLYASGCFDAFDVLQVPEGEEAAANAIRVNDKVLMPEGFPATAQLLRHKGYSLVELPVTQAALLDGGLSCMSLRFNH